MAPRFLKMTSALRRVAVASIACGILLSLLTDADAQRIGGSSVGGVWVDVDGVLNNVDTKDLAKLRKIRSQALSQISGDLNKPSDMRKFSLRQLIEAIRAHDRKATGDPLPDEIRYLAGLQRIQYIFVYPEQHDIVLAGPADGWKVNDRAEVVGKTTGLPVLKLDDLLVALRTATSSPGAGISCSIDPTNEGILRYNKFFAKQKTFNRGIKKGIENSLGMHTITLTGVPTSSHYAHVLVAADYRMKRYALGLEEPPIKGMPSYLSILQKSQATVRVNSTPRWWIAPDYKPLLTDDEGLVWEIRPGVKIMTEDERRDASGQVQGTGRANPYAKRWAESMTAKFNELKAKDSIFADLQNCIDLSVVATIIVREKLAEKVDLSLDGYMDADALSVAALDVPKQIATEVSLAKRRKQWLITASGGVQFNSWSIASKSAKSDTLGSVRGENDKSRTSWWWD